MKICLSLLLAAALAGFALTFGTMTTAAFTFAVVAMLAAWTLAQYHPARPRWQPKLRTMTGRRPGATDVPLRFPVAKARQSVPAQLTLAE